MHSALAAMAVNALSPVVVQLSGSHFGLSINPVCACRYGTQRDTAGRTYWGTRYSK